MILYGFSSIVVFRVYDKDRDGKISKEDLTQVHNYAL